MTNKKINKNEVVEDIAKIKLSGLTIIMSGTLFIYFIWAVFNNKFLINFSIDAIVGALALVFLVKNIIMKYKIIEKYTNSKEFKFLDISSIALCFLIKWAFMIPFDFSMVILLISYYITKNRFNAVVK